MMPRLLLLAAPLVMALALIGCEPAGNGKAQLGKPLEISFQALDGRSVDLQKMQGKVVLVDFWATWCGPCVAELPKVQATYEKLRGQGFEIVGISLDEDERALRSFIQAKGILWPQFFDGRGWKNKLAEEYGVRSVPTMWLVDRKGNLREMSAEQDLEGKVQKLLAEK